jgi:hypothetical protein
MSLLVRAALLGGLAYVVSRAVRKSQLSIDSSRAEARRLARNADGDEDEQWSTDKRPSTTYM